MLKSTRILLACTSIVSLLLGSWYALHNDIEFHADIARDFLLLNEVAIKKIILIGPRADWKGLFHGPLWYYFNFPGYFIGRGDPVIVGWYWIFLCLVFAVIYFFLVKRIFNKSVAFIYSSLFLVCMIHYMNKFYNPVGALLFMPIYYFFFVVHYRTKNIWYTLALLFSSGIILHFQLAVGIPLILLTILYLLWDIFRSKRYLHILAFMILLIPLSTFILFDVRHNFSYVHGIINHFSGKEQFQTYGLMSKIDNRIDNMTGFGLGFFHGDLNPFNRIIGYVMAIGIALTLIRRDTKWRREYWIFLYLYGGYYLLSFIHSGQILVHYALPFISLTILIFSSMYENVSKKVFALTFIFIVLLNFVSAYCAIRDSSKFIGINPGSWKFISHVARTMYEDAPPEFGVYIYTPDVYAYAPKYAVTYMQSLYPSKHMSYSQKLRVTYLLYEPPPNDRPELNGIGWKEGQVRIKSRPIKILHFVNGYKLEKYKLSNDELKIPSDPLIADWISQR